MELTQRSAAPLRKKRTSLNLILGVMFTMLLFATLVNLHQERTLLVQSELEQRSHDFSSKIFETLRMSVENLHAASTVMVFFDDINYDQFNAITARYFTTDPGLMIVEWQPVITQEDRQTFVAKTRQNGLPAFRLWEPDTAGNPIHAKTRDTHVPVLFMSSRDRSQSAVNTLGLDLAWSFERMKSKWDARDLGRARSSELFKIVTGQAKEYEPLGFAITLPVYKNGVVPDSKQDRQANIIGYMAGVYHLEKLLEKSLNNLIAEGINIDIHDHMDNENRLIKSAGISTSFLHEIELDSFGNSIHIVLTATDRFVSSKFNPSWALLPILIVLSGIFTIFFINQLGKQAESLAQARNELERVNIQLRELSRHDPLTNLYNRRAFLEILNEALERLKRQPQTIALLMLDIDFFKGINDKWGHPVGDDVLQAFANACQNCSRNVDIIGRIGGEEFAVLLTSSNQEEAYAYAERLRTKICALGIPIRNQADIITLTVSIGLTLVDQPMSSSQILEQADNALYKAKRNGRNTIQIYR